MKIRKTIPLASGLILAYLILEALLRIIPSVQFRLAEKKLHCSAAFYFRLCPDQHIRFTHPSGFSFTVTTNASGERITGPVTQQGRLTSLREIWILGDSIAMGYGVSDEESFPYLLQDRLQAQVRNLGVDSMGTAAMADLLQDTSGNPAFIFWPFSPSDFIDDPAESALKSSRLKRTLFTIRAVLTRRSAVVALIKQWRERGRRDAYLAGALVDRSHPTFQGILNLNKNALERGSRLCVVLYQDVQAGGNRPEKTNAMRDDVAAFLKEQSICTVDARPAFLAYSGEDLYLPNDGHPAQAAQRLIANEIEMFLRNQRF